MLSRVVGPLRQAARALVTGDWPRQLAAGFALGLAVVLAPSGNLIAVSLCVLLFSLRVNEECDCVASVPADSQEEAASCAD
jgi:uncharacterized protein (DUF2062 family)